MNCLDSMPHLLMPQNQSEEIAAAIHKWIAEIFPGSGTGAYCSHDYGYTVISIPNVKIFYRDVHLIAKCWITNGGVNPINFRGEYADPELFTKLGRLLREWYEKELTVRERLHSRCREFVQTNFAAL